jgi:hypothetical protein
VSAALALWLAVATLPCGDLAKAPKSPEALDAQVTGPVFTASLPREEPARTRAVTERLQLACQLKAKADAPPRPDRARLEAILARPEFDAARRSDSDAMARLLALLNDWLVDFLTAQGTADFADVTRKVVLALAAVAALTGTVHSLRKRRRARLGPRAAASPARGEALALDAPVEHLQRAREALSADAREAIRQALLALLASLERKRLARPDRVRTNRELAADLPKRGAPAELTEQVSALMRWYDARFYSLQPVSDGDAAGFVEQVDALARTLEEPAR